VSRRDLSTWSARQEIERRVVATTDILKSKQIRRIDLEPISHREHWRREDAIHFLMIKFAALGQDNQINTQAIYGHTTHRIGMRFEEGEIPYLVPLGQQRGQRDGAVPLCRHFVSVLASWAERQRLSAQQAETIRLAVTRTAAGLDAAWWQELFRQPGQIIHSINDAISPVAAWTPVRLVNSSPALLLK
jgi:hypothetical protein